MDDSPARARFLAKFHPAVHKVLVDLHRLGQFNTKTYAPEPEDIESMTHKVLDALNVVRTLYGLDKIGE